MPASPMPSAEPREEYTRRLEARRAALAMWMRRYMILGNLRVLVFFAAVAMAFAAFHRGTFSA